MIRKTLEKEIETLKEIERVTRELRQDKEGILRKIINKEILEQ